MPPKDFFTNPESRTVVAENINERVVKPLRAVRWFALALLGLLLLGVTLVTVAAIRLQPPSQFPVNRLLVIPEGATTQDVAYLLHDEQYIQAPEIFSWYMRFRGSDTGVKWGDYTFERVLSAVEIAERLINGEHGDVTVQVTIPEGSTVRQIGRILDASGIRDFDRNQFEELTNDLEGYLFPDTYFFFRSATTEEVIQAMRDNFDRRIEPLSLQIKESPRSFEDIMIMASLIEREAYGDEDLYLISGILWKRIDIGMRLQVDAPFVYFLGKGSASLTRADLNIDSPYNTYRYEGLPPTPIGSPGYDAIQAALNPVESPYLFFLHDARGNAYYAEDHAGHVRNKNLYLR